MFLRNWFRSVIRWMRVRVQWIRTPESLKRQAAVHESGHALAAWLQPSFIEVTVVTIVPNGPFRGYTQSTHVLSLPPVPGEILQLMTMGMAGAVAEDLLLDARSDGSIDDVIHVLAWWLFMRYGMALDTAQGIAASLVMDLGSADELKRFNAESVVTPPIGYAAAEAYRLLRPRLDDLAKLAKALRRKKTLNHADLLKILGPRPA